MTANEPKQAQAPAGWELLPHDADVRVHGWGPTPNAAFEQAALALTAIITDAHIEDSVAVEISCEAPDLELLFVDWLNAIIFEMATRQMLFGRFEPSIENNRLKATIWGESVDRVRHAPACEAKGATYTALQVAEVPKGQWSATCVVDV